MEYKGYMISDRGANWYDIIKDDKVQVMVLTLENAEKWIDNVVEPHDDDIYYEDFSS
jgi:hypothetical protein